MNKGNYYGTSSDMVQKKENYLGEDGFIHCGVCGEPLEEKYEDGISYMGKTVHPRMCSCMLARQEEIRARKLALEHEDRVISLRAKCFSDPKLRKMTFAASTAETRQMAIARRYADSWELVKEKNEGLLFHGTVGTGKTYMAACIANALLEREIPVRMTNFSTIMNDLGESFQGRSAYLDSLCGTELLILDDFGMERSTDYALEQVFQVIDRRCQTEKPLIITTNLTVEQLRNPKDLHHQRIYDRVLSMCRPVSCQGASMRRGNPGYTGRREAG